MLTREYEILIHRYLDRELDAASILRVEEHLRHSPASRAYLEELESLDQDLSNAFSGIVPQTDALEQQILQQLVITKSHPEQILPDLTNYRRILRSLKIAAALVFLAIGIQIAILAIQRGNKKKEDPSSLLHAQLAVKKLKAENKRLRLVLKDRSSFASHPFSPMEVGIPKVDVSRKNDIASPPPPSQPKKTDPPDKKVVFASIQTMLQKYRQTGKWDPFLAGKVMRDLGNLKNLTPEDFTHLQNLYYQQDKYTPGQIFLAQAISQYCTQHEQGRRFVYEKIDDELNRWSSGDQSLGDRFLRRAWSYGLMNNHDPRNIDYLLSLGSQEPDVFNRSNILHGLSSIGSSDAVLALAQLATQEPNAYLKEEAFRQIRDQIFLDPTIAQDISGDLKGLMEQIIKGSFGANGENWETMFLAFEILAQMGFNYDELFQEWSDRNKREQGGDPRGTQPPGAEGK